MVEFKIFSLKVSIFVGNLPFRAEREDVLELFSPYGEVTNCSLPLERDTGRKRGFAFVEMADEATESSAIENLQGSEMMGRPLRINKAEPRTNSPRRNNNYNSRGSNNSGGYTNNGYGGNNSGGYTNNGYGGNNSGGYGSNNSGGYTNNGYGGNNFNNDQNTNFDSKSSGAKGWEDRSFGNNTENSEFENSRSRRKRGASSNLDQQEDM